LTLRFMPTALEVAVGIADESLLQATRTDLLSGRASGASAQPPSVCHDSECVPCSIRAHFSIIRRLVVAPVTITFQRLRKVTWLAMGWIDSLLRRVENLPAMRVQN
jgi:hypothetical protein